MSRLRVAEQTEDQPDLRLDDELRSLVEARTPARHVDSVVTRLGFAGHPNTGLHEGNLVRLRDGSPLFVELRRGVYALVGSGRVETWADDRGGPVLAAEPEDVGPGGLWVGVDAGRTLDELLAASRAVRRRRSGEPA